MDDLVDIATGGPGKPKTDTPPAVVPAVSGPIGGASVIPGATTVTPPAKIPLPDFNNPASRLKYAQAITKSTPLMQGRGDTFLRYNETPDGASDTAKNLAIKSGKKLGLDPALLYASSMEEGMSGLFPDKNNQVDTAEDPKYPVDGYASFGLDTFSDKFKGLVAKGYLTPDFANNFSKSVRTNEKKETVNSANFKDVDSAIQAKAAVMKDTYDDIDSYAKKRGIALSPRARDFFTLADYNGGEGTGHQMLNDYYNNGHLVGDKFLDARPVTGTGLKSTSYKGIYENVMRRIKARDILKNQGAFE